MRILTAAAVQVRGHAACWLARPRRAGHLGSAWRPEECLLCARKRQLAARICVPQVKATIDGTTPEAANALVRAPGGGSRPRGGPARRAALPCLLSQPVPPSCLTWPRLLIALCGGCACRPLLPSMLLLLLPPAAAAVGHHGRRCGGACRPRLPGAGRHGRHAAAGWVRLPRCGCQAGAPAGLATAAASPSVSCGCSVSLPRLTCQSSPLPCSRHRQVAPAAQAAPAQAAAAASPQAPQAAKAAAQAAAAAASPPQASYEKAAALATAAPPADPRAPAVRWRSCRCRCCQLTSNW